MLKPVVLLKIFVETVLQFFSWFFWSMNAYLLNTIMHLFKDLFINFI